MSDTKLMTVFNGNQKPEYELMNKDQQIASFTVNDALNYEIGRASCRERV